MRIGVGKRRQVTDKVEQMRKYYKVECSGVALCSRSRQSFVKGFQHETKDSNGMKEISS